MSSDGRSSRGASGQERDQRSAQGQERGIGDVQPSGERRQDGRSEQESEYGLEYEHGRSPDSIRRPGGGPPPLCLPHRATAFSGGGRRQCQGATCLRGPSCAAAALAKCCVDGGNDAARCAVVSCGASDPIFGRRANGEESHLAPAVRTFRFERNGQSDTITDFRSIYFESTLDEAQEVPPNADSAGIDGTGAGVLNFARTDFDFSLDINGIDLTGGPASTT